MTSRADQSLLLWRPALRGFDRTLLEQSEAVL
jgi:hypothetical protein